MKKAFLLLLAVLASMPCAAMAGFSATDASQNEEASLRLYPEESAAGVRASQNAPCVPPVSPYAFQGAAESAANDLNAQVMAYNEFADAANDYMACVANEGERQARKASLEALRQAQEKIDAMQGQVAQLRAQLPAYSRQEPPAASRQDAPPAATRQDTPAQR